MLHPAKISSFKKFLDPYCDPDQGTMDLDCDPYNHQNLTYDYNPTKNFVKIHL